MHCTVRFPSTLQIQIVEREPAYAFAGTNGWSMVDAEGVVIITGATNIPPGLAVFDGDCAPIANKEPGDSLPKTRRELALKTTLLQEMLEASDIKEDDGWTLADNVATVRLEDEAVVFSLRIDGEPGVSVEDAGNQSQIYFYLDPAAEGADAAITWLRNALRSKAMGGLGSGSIDLRNKQRVFIPAKTLR